MAPGSVVRRQGRRDPRMYMSRLPVLAAAGISIVRVPLSSGVDISLKKILFSIETPIIWLKNLKINNVLDVKCIQV